MQNLALLPNAIDPAYRSLPDTTFMFHDTIAAYIRKLKDGQGRYLWEPSLQVGMPALESQTDPALTEPYPLDVLVAQNQGMVGY